nr:MAG: Thymopoietin protein [Bacteriophage sp.]
MAYIVTKNIIDTKDNNRFYEVGDLYPRPDFTVSGARIAELVGKGVIVAEGKAEAPAPAPAPTEEAEEKPLEKLKVAELKELLEKSGVEYEADAKKADLVALAQTIEGE